MICFDSSVAAKWFVEEEYSANAKALRDRALATSESMIDPYMLPSEVANILRQNVRRGSLDDEAAQGILAQFFALPIQFMSSVTLYHRALEIANTHNLPAAYDAHYVALSEMAGATFWTADQRLLRALHGTFPFVHSIAGFAIP